MRGLSLCSPNSTIRFPFHSWQPLTPPKEGCYIFLMSATDLEKCDQLTVPSYTATKSASVASDTYKDDQVSLPPSVVTLDDEYPDGGWTAWLTVIGAFLALLCTFGQLTSFGTFQSWYSTHQLQQLPPSTISWIGSLQLLVFFFSVSSSLTNVYTLNSNATQGGPIGRLFDSFGPRVLMIPGTFILVLSIMLTSICKQYYQYILCQGILFGLGVGLL